MYNQEEFIYSEFTKNYPDTDIPIVIYGVGVDAGKLLPKIPEYNIVGLMDGKKKNGEFCGRRIIDYPEVIDRGIKNIVIVARPAVLGIIYHRIEQFAIEHGIFVGDVRGRNLAKVYKSKETDIPFFHKNWSDMWEACQGCDIVTFDIFDTLLVRQSMRPADIFEIVEMSLVDHEGHIDNFAQMRMEAEKRCYQSGLNPTIYQIYDEMQKMIKCSQQVKQMYLDMEICTEEKFIRPRKSMLQFFEQISETRKIYLISDMYLSSGILDKLLEKCGYKGYQKIYVSCEYNCSKSDGLFERFLEEVKDSEKVIHIGDNEIADGICARLSGMKTFEIMSELEMLENSAYSCLVDKAVSILDRISVGLFCNKAFDDPFALYDTKGKLQIKGHQELAYLFVAPELVFFSCWLINHIVRSDCEFILYPSRDAYVIEKICKKLVEDQEIVDYPDGAYVYVSRRAMCTAAVYDQKDAEDVLAQEYRGDIVGLFESRFNMKIPETAEAVSQERIHVLSSKYLRSILQNCKSERDNYLKYLQKRGIKQGKKLAFIDFVAAGTIQKALGKIIENEIEGFYFLKRDVSDKSDIKVNSFYTPKGDFELDGNIYKYYLFFELILTSSEATLKYIDADLKPVFMEEDRKPKEINIIMEMQEEILLFAAAVAKLHPNILAEDVNNSVPDTMAGFIGKEYSNIVCEEIKTMVLTDEYLNRTFNIFDN